MTNYREELSPEQNKYVDLIITKQLLALIKQNRDTLSFKQKAKILKKAFDLGGDSVLTYHKNSLYGRIKYKILKKIIYFMANFK